MANIKPETQIRKAMQSLGTYKKEFDPVITILCQLKKQYDALTKKFEDDGYPFSEVTSSGTKKAPIVVTLEGLRRDILSYYSQLGLTPHGLKKLNDQAMAESKAESPLAAALKELGGL